MAETLSYHTGTGWSYEHNFNPDKRKEEPHIDPQLTEQNVILKQETLLHAYEVCFKDSLEAYNEKQISKGHPELQKGDIEQYLEDIQKKFKEEQERKARGENLGHRAVRPCYETIIQVGDRNSSIPRDEQIEILKDMYAKFRQENPNFYVFGAVIHADERSPQDGKLSGIHMHLDYIPVARCTRGLEFQPVLSRAIYQVHGYKTDHVKDTAQMKWQTHMRESLADVAREHGIEIVHKHENREHLEKEQYRLTQQNKEAERQVQEQQRNLDSVKTSLESARSAYDSVSSDLKDKRQELEQAKEVLKRHVEPPKPKKSITVGEYYPKKEMDAYLRFRDAQEVKDRQEHMKVSERAKDADRAEFRMNEAIQQMRADRERADLFEQMLQSPNPKKEYRDYVLEHEQEREPQHAREYER